METFWQDFRYAMRTLAKEARLHSIAVLSLTLGIGANTTIFTLVKAVFLHPIPIKDPSSRSFSVYYHGSAKQRRYTIHHICSWPT